MAVVILVKFTSTNSAYKHKIGFNCGLKSQQKYPKKNTNKQGLLTSIKAKLRNSDRQPNELIDVNPKIFFVFKDFIKKYVILDIYDRQKLLYYE